MIIVGNAVKLLTTRSAFHHFAAAMNQRTPFKTSGALKGGPSPEAKYFSGWNLGHLNEKWYDSVRSADYIVWSYGTPIAWHVPCTCNGMGFIANRWVFTGECGCKSGWVVPDDKYSVTTTKHQSKIVAAVSELS